MKNFSIAITFLFFNGCFGGDCSDPDPYVPDRPEDGTQADCFSRGGDKVDLGWNIALGNVADDYESFQFFEDTIPIEDGFQGGSHLRLGVEVTNATFQQLRFADRPVFADEELEGWVRFSVMLDGEEIAYSAPSFEYMYWQQFDGMDGYYMQENVQFLGAPNVDDFLNKDLQIKVSIDFCGKADFYEEEIILKTDRRIDG